MKKYLGGFIGAWCLFCMICNNKTWELFADKLFFWVILLAGTLCLVWPGNPICRAESANTGVDAKRYALSLGGFCYGLLLCMVPKYLSYALDNPWISLGTLPLLILAGTLFYRIDKKGYLN